MNIKEIKDMAMRADLMPSEIVISLIDEIESINQTNSDLKLKISAMLDPVVFNKMSGEYADISSKLRATITELGDKLQIQCEKLAIAEEALNETKKDIEHNAEDTLWCREVYAMTVVDRIEIALAKIKETN